jgi:hypothetical protein
LLSDIVVAKPELTKHDLDMKPTFRTLSSVLAIISMSTLSCDDRVKHIDVWGTIIMRDQCEIDGRPSWIVDLDMELTFAPKGVVLPVVSDTVNGKQYNNLVRIFVVINADDTTYISKGDKFNFKLEREPRPCNSNRSTLSSYSPLSNEYVHMPK